MQKTVCTKNFKVECVMQCSVSVYSEQQKQRWGRVKKKEIITLIYLPIVLF